MAKYSLQALSDSLTGRGPNPIFNFNPPTFAFDGDLPSMISSLAEFSAEVGNAVQRVSEVAHLAYCLGSALLNPNMLLGILDKIAGNLAAVAFDVANRIATAIEGQITAAMSTLVGTALNFVNSIVDFVNSVINFYKSLRDLWENIKTQALNSWKNFVSQEDCEFLLASIAACLLNKLYGDKLQKFEQRVTQRITREGQRINQALTEELTDTNNLSNYIRHCGYMMDKANAQIGLLY